jgi:hypothetical protein
MRAFTRGMYRYKSDREFAKKALAKFAQLDDQKMVEATCKNMPCICREFRAQH